MMSSNCSGSLSRPSTSIVYWKSWPLGAGGWPTWPAATCTFCSRRASTTSWVVSRRALSFAGSIQIRMLYSVDAEDPDVADAVDPAQLVADPERGVVGQEEAVVRPLRRGEGDDQDDVGRLLLDGHPLPPDLLGQERLGDRHPVLDHDLRGVEVGADLEGDRQACTTRRSRRWRTCRACSPRR